MNTLRAPNGWKRSYWPEPKGKTSITRASVIRALHPKAKPSPRLTVAAALVLLRQQA